MGVAPDLAQVRGDWLGRELHRASYVIDQQAMLDWAEACGEVDPRFTDPSHPDFQAHPVFAGQFMQRQILPDDFPQLGDGPSIDGGKSVEVTRPIRAGEELDATSTVAEVYDKTGRSGTMYFIVHRTTFRDRDGQEVAVVDSRMIQPRSGA